MKELTAQVICGFGVGTSTLLKIKIQSILGELGVDANVFTGDVASAGEHNTCDVIFTTAELVQSIRGNVQTPIIIIENFIDSDEIKGKMEEFLTTRE